jgi:hypothetical protein
MNIHGKVQVHIDTYARLFHPLQFNILCLFNQFWYPSFNRASSYLISQYEYYTDSLVKCFKISLKIPQGYAFEKLKFRLGWDFQYESWSVIRTWDFRM